MTTSYIVRLLIFCCVCMCSLFILYVNVFLLFLHMANVILFVILFPFHIPAITNAYRLNSIKNLSYYLMTSLLYEILKKSFLCDAILLLWVLCSSIFISASWILYCCFHQIVFFHVMWLVCVKVQTADSMFNHIQKYTKQDIKQFWLHINLLLIFLFSLLSLRLFVPRMSHFFSHCHQSVVNMYS